MPIHEIYVCGSEMWRIVGPQIEYSEQNEIRRSRSSEIVKGTPGIFQLAYNHPRLPCGHFCFCRG